MWSEFSGVLETFRLACFTSIQLVSPMVEQFCTAVGPVAVDVGRQCVARHLISQNDFDELREAHGSRVQCDHLLSKLQGGGYKSYNVLKEILSTWPPKSSPAVLLRTIQDVEKKLDEGVCVCVCVCLFVSVCVCVCVCVCVTMLVLEGCAPALWSCLRCVFVHMHVRAVCVHAQECTWS